MDLKDQLPLSSDLIVGRLSGACVQVGMDTCDPAEPMPAMTRR
jgi:hypothetical protein